MKKQFFLRMFCVLLAFAAVSSVLCLSISSAEQSKNPFYDIVCTYDVKREIVIIEYRMSSEDVSNYSDCIIYAYRLPFGLSFDNAGASVIEPIGEGNKPANRSTFEIPVSSLSDRLSTYVLSMETKDGRLTSAVAVPSVDGSVASAGFKGIESESIMISADSSPQTAKVNVDIESLDGGSSGYLFSTYGETYIFNRSYVSELDKAVKNYRSTGTAVYLNLISEKFESGSELYSADYQMKLYACAAFLISRYSDEEYGGLAGIVFGNENPRDDQVKLFAASLYAFGAAASDLEIDCPLIVSMGGGESRIKKFLTSLCNLSSQYSLPKFTLMLESDRIPLGMKPSAEGNGGAVLIDRKANSEYITAESLSAFEQYLKNLARRTDALYPSIIYNWNPEFAESAEVLKAAYAYNYYKLYFDSSAVAYLVSFDGLSEEYQKVLADAVNFAGTNLSSKYEEEEKILDIIGISSWEIEISGFIEGKADQDKIYLNEASTAPSNNVLGVYEYFDFSSATDISAWFSGGGCEGISSVKNDFGKGMSAKMTLQQNAKGFITHNYKYKESFKYTDRISLGFSFDAPEGNQDSYSVKIILGGDGFRYEYTAEGFSPNKMHKVYLNVSDLTAQNEVKYIRIVSSSEATDEYRLSLYSMTAESFVYDDEELNNLIEEERERLKSTYGEDKIKPGAIAFVIIVFALSALVIVMISRKRRSGNNYSDDE